MAEDFNEAVKEAEEKIEEKKEELEAKADEVKADLKEKLAPAKEFFKKVKKNFGQLCDYINTAEWIPSKAFFVLLFIADVIATFLFWLF